MRFVSRLREQIGLEHRHVVVFRYALPNGFIELAIQRQVDIFLRKGRHLDIGRHGVATGTGGDFAGGDTRGNEQRQGKREWRNDSTKIHLIPKLTKKARHHERIAGSFES